MEPEARSPRKAVRAQPRPPEAARRAEPSRGSPSRGRTSTKRPSRAEPTARSPEPRRAEAARSAEPRWAELVRGRTRVSKRPCASPYPRLGSRSGRPRQPRGSPPVGPTLVSLRRGAAWPDEAGAEGSARPAARGSRVGPSGADRGRTPPSPSAPAPRLPPPPLRKCPSAAGQANPASAAAARQLQTRRYRGPSGAEAKMAEGTRAARGREAAGIGADSVGGAWARWRLRGEVRVAVGPTPGAPRVWDSRGLAVPGGAGSMGGGPCRGWRASRGRGQGDLALGGAGPLGDPPLDLAAPKAVPVSPAPKRYSVACTGPALMLLPPVGVPTLGVTSAAGNTCASLWVRASSVCVVHRSIAPPQRVQGPVAPQGR